jgi:hypothetical protein
MRFIQKSVIVLSALAIISCKSSQPNSSSEVANSPSASTSEEKEILNCMVRKESAGGGAADTWNLSIKMTSSAVKILYQSRERGELGIVYKRLRNPNIDSADNDTRFVFSVHPEADLFGGGGPRIKEVDNDVEHFTAIGEFFNTLSPSSVFLRARMNAQNQIEKADFGITYPDLNDNKKPKDFTDAYTTCIPGTIKKFG